MKLHQVKLRNYRGVEESEVTFSENGVTIIEGPNEVGKTAIAEGLQLAIDVPDTSRSGKVRAVQPVGRDEGPEVEISLSTGGYELVYSKRWLRQAATTLEIEAPRRESFTGRQAHDRLKGILAETLDDELWQALRIQQGTELMLPSFALPSMGRALDEAAGGELVSDREETLWTSIEEEYDKYWTTTGRERSDRGTSEQRVNEAQAKVADLEGQLQEIESDVAQISRLIGESTRLSHALKEFADNEREFEQRWNVVDRLRLEVERLEAVHGESKAQLDSSDSKWQRRQELIAVLETSTEALKALEAEAEDAVPGFTAATRRSEGAITALKEAEASLLEARKGFTRAIADRDHLRQLIEVDQLKERHERYLAAERILKEAEEYLESAVVDDDVAKRIEDAYIADERAKSAAGSAAGSIEVTALREINVEIGDELVELATDGVKNTLVEDELMLTIPTVARMRVSAGSESKELAAQRHRTQETYQLLCEEARVADVSDARRAAQDRQDAQRNKDDALKAIERELRDLTPDVLLGKVSSLTEKVTSYPEDRPDEPPLPSDLDEAQLIEGSVSALVTECESTLSACEDASQSAEVELKALQFEEVDRTAKLEIARKNKQNAASQISLAREGQADEDLLADLSAAKCREKCDRQAFEEANAQLSNADPDSVEILLENARQATERARAELQSNRDQQNGLRSSLDLRGERGLQTALDEAANELNHYVRDHERQEARAETVRLLRETFAKHRHQARQRYIQPLKERIDQFGRIVFGTTFEVELDKDLQVVRRTLDGTTLDVSQLSTGAREQLGVISRLACATIVSPLDGGAPVMIDDSLGWSDPRRLQSMGAAIAAAGKQCQVIVLTCTPGRYSHVGTATVVSL